MRANFNSLLELDKQIRRLEGVYYYARYVDDIIVFTTKDPSALKNDAENLLPPGMVFNEKKSELVSVTCKCIPACTCAPSPCACKDKCKCKEHPALSRHLDYVGYKLIFSSVPTTPKKAEMKVMIEMSEKKLKRLKSRIVIAFLHYIRDKNYGMLKDRLTFLTENHRLVRSGSRGKLMAGVYYNNLLVDDANSFKQLDRYLRSILHGSCSSFTKRLAAHLASHQKVELAKLSFVSGFRSKRSRRITSGLAKSIRGCWDYV